MNHTVINTMIIILSLYVVFGADFRMAFFSKGADEAFSVITVIIMCVFTAETIINAISEDKYLNSFYFWLDILATLSLLIDIQWVDRDVSSNYGIDYSTSDPAESALLAREWFGSQAGTQIDRITRILRLAKYVRIGRLWKQANIILNKHKN